MGLGCLLHNAGQLWKAGIRQGQLAHCQHCATRDAQAGSRGSTHAIQARRHNGQPIWTTHCVQRRSGRRQEWARRRNRRQGQYLLPKQCRIAKPAHRQGDERFAHEGRPRTQGEIEPFFAQCH